MQKKNGEIHMKNTANALILLKYEENEKQIQK
jgi:hypothetical protein